MLWSRTLWSSNDVLWRPELLWSGLFQPESLSDASFISYENKFRCGTCVQIILSDWRSSQKREAYWLTPRLHGESGQILEQTNFITNAISFYTNRANSVADCSTVCCSKLACFRPASRGNVRQIWASFCPDLCKRALREFPHTKYFFCYALRSQKEVTRRKSNVHPCTNFEPNGPWCVDYKQTSSLSLSNHKDVAFSFVYFLKRPCESRVTICALLASLYDS